MTTDETVEIRSFVHSREVHRAASVSIAIHLLLLAIWLAGQTFDLWRFIPKQRFAKISETLFHLPRSKPMIPAKPEMEELLEQAATLAFVEVDPTRIADEKPKDAKFYGAVNTLAANPEAGNDPALPKVEGGQTEYVKITENSKSIPQPLPPPPSPVKENISPNESQISQTASQPVPPAEPPPAPAEQSTANKSEPPRKVAATKPDSKNAETISSKNPVAPNTSPSDLPNQEISAEADLTLTKEGEPNQTFAAASIEETLSKDLLTPERQEQEGGLEAGIDAQENISEPGTALETPVHPLGNRTEVAYFKPQQNQAFDVQKDPSGTAAPPRPRTLAEVERGSEGEKSSIDGGVQRVDLSSSLGVEGTVIGDYDQRLVIAVRQRWDTLLLDKVGLIQPGKVVLDFRIHMDGRISELKVRESNVGESQTLYCQMAILDPAPYSRWPSAMRNEIKSDSRDVTFTFYYFAQ